MISDHASIIFYKSGYFCVDNSTRFFVNWELFLRNKGIKISYYDGEILWADKCVMVYEPSDKATVSLAHPATNLTLILLPGNNLRVTMQYSLQ